MSGTQKQTNLNLPNGTGIVSSPGDLSNFVTLILDSNLTVTKTGSGSWTNTGVSPNLISTFNLISLPSSPLVNGERVTLNIFNGNTNSSLVGINYFVVNASGNSFQISRTINGAPLGLSFNTSNNFSVSTYATQVCGFTTYDGVRQPYKVPAGKKLVMIGALSNSVGLRLGFSTSVPVITDRVIADPAGYTEYSFLPDDWEIINYPAYGVVFPSNTYPVLKTTANITFAVPIICILV